MDLSARPRGHKGRPYIHGWLPALICGAILAAPPQAAARPIVVLMTDFGHLADSVAICKGVMLGINPELTIVDLTQDVPHFDIGAGALLLEGAVKYYPKGTAFVAVVDPGVGTQRRSIAARTQSGHYLVGPDNGLLSLALDQLGAEEVREITNRALFNQLDPISNTFHGRDIYSPIGAHLASGVEFASVGPVVRDWIRLPRSEPSREDGVLRGEAAFIDTVFGNITTNIPAQWMAELGVRAGDFVDVRIGEKRLILRFARTFGEVELGELLIYPSSRGVLDLAIRQGDFAVTFGTRPHHLIEIRPFQRP
ncbi:MAG TPA: S-adenosyl-l-methionine hydroxide adenosyltransferase family protein [Acidobacteriota bacterium]